jgi:hypothetical protein
VTAGVEDEGRGYEPRDAGGSRIGKARSGVFPSLQQEALILDF